MIEAKAEQQKVLIYEIQNARSRIHWTIDCWSAPNRLSKIGICSRFVNKYGTLRNVTVALRNLDQRHHSPYLAQKFLLVIDK